MTKRLLPLFAVGLIATTILAADPATKPAKKPKPAKSQRHQLIDHGPFVTATIPSQWEAHGIVNKAIAVKFIDPKTEAVVGGVMFDTDACRLAAGWTGGFVEFTKDWTSVRDSKSVKIIGTQIVGTRPAPGWAAGDQAGPDAWKDPRPDGFGPLPKDRVQYRGLYRFKNDIVFAYDVAGVRVLEMAVMNKAADQPMLMRYLQIAPTDKPLHVAVCDLAPGQTAKAAEDAVTIDGAAEGRPAAMRIDVLDLPKGGAWHTDGTDGGRLSLTIPPADKPRLLCIRHWAGDAKSADAVAADMATSRKEIDFPESFQQALFRLTQGGPAHWPTPVVTAGKLAEPRDKNVPYVVDTLTLPDDNPWQSWMRPGGFDFFTSDPDKAAICNWSGDVWTVSGVSGDLKELRWRRIASGLFTATGIADRRRPDLRHRPRPDHPAGRSQSRRRDGLLRVLQQRHGGDGELPRVHLRSADRQARQLLLCQGGTGP